MVICIHSGARYLKDSSPPHWSMPSLISVHPLSSFILPTSLHWMFFCLKMTINSRL